MLAYKAPVCQKTSEAHTVIHVIYSSWRDERLSLPGWLTHSIRFTYEVGTCQAFMRHKSGKVRQPKTDVLTIESRHQQDSTRYSLI